MQNLWPKIEEQAAGNAASAQEVALVGAGFYGQAAQECLKKQNIRVICFADNNPARQGTTQDGVPIVPLAELPKKNMALITAQHAFSPISAQLKTLGIKHLTFDGFYAQRNLARLRKVRDGFVDDRSKEVFDRILLTRLTGDASHCREVMERHQYAALPQFMQPGPTHYVDAGAYVGDSVEQFLWNNAGVFKKIYAFEPGVRQFSAMKARMQRLAAEWAYGHEDVECVQAALGDADETKSFASAPDSLHSSAISENGNQSVRVTTLDKFLQGREVTLIKADVEGMELAMLKGAAESIRKYKPKLAISIYHKPDDLFSIPEYIKSLVPEYRMAVRHHSPVMMETVLYCWIGDVV